MARDDPNGQDSGFQLPFERPVMRLQRQIEELETAQAEQGRDYADEIRQLRAQWVSLVRKTYDDLSPWETVQVARHPSRPLAGDYIRRIVQGFVELHGDRCYGDDQALRGGIGHIGPQRLLVLAQEKGRDTKDKLARNFGMAHPEGYRKAIRLLRLAEKFHLPVLTLIDTAGAYPGIGAEERGVAEAIARSMQTMSRLRTPILCVVIGEGGSGGALGIGVGDRVAMLEYAYYSVISPEGCASILWRSGEKAPEAAEAMKLTARDLRRLDVVDDIIPEPLGGAHRNPAEAATNLERYVVRAFRQLQRVDTATLLEGRYQRWRRMGKVAENVQQPAPAST